MKAKTFFWIYILLLSNGSYYTGYTRDLVRRYRQHRSGKAARITRSFRPVRIAACWKLYAGKGAALRLEAWIKAGTRQEKQRLIEDPQALARLAARRAGCRLLLVRQDPRLVEGDSTY